MKRILLAVAILLLAVSAQATNDVTVGWDTPQSGIVSVEVYSGNACGTYGPPIVVAQPANQAMMKGLADGFWCFSAKAIDGKGNKSDYATPVYITLTTPPKALDGFKIITIVNTVVTR